jgi:hypothetical protein
MNSPYFLGMEGRLDHEKNLPHLMQFPSVTALPLAPFPKYIEYNPVLVLHNDIWHNADNICGDHEQKCRNDWNDRQVGCRTAAIVPKLIPNKAFS